MPKLQDRIKELNSEELRNLIEQMCKRHPDLFELLGAPSPVLAKVLDPDDLAEEIQIAFRPALRGGWRESTGLCTSLEVIARRGRDYFECGEFATGVAVFSTLIREIVNRYADIFDSEGEVAVLVDGCVGDLDRVLSQIVGAPRDDALNSILVASVFGQDYGVAKEGPRILAEGTHDREREALSTEVDRMLGEVSREGERQFLGELLIRLRGNRIDLEGQAEIHRRAGNHPEWVNVLLLLHRPEEATAVFAEISESRVIPEVADIFCRHGYAEHARRSLERLAVSCETSGHWMILEWLYRYATKVSDSRARARWAEELFWEHPATRTWGLLRESVSGTDRTRVRHRLAAEGKFVLLVRILLADGQPRRALTQYRRIPSRDRTSEVLDLGSKIAEGIDVAKPSVAAELWLDVADHYAKRGHREDYDEATRYVKLGCDALLAANHPVLAKRHVAGFRKQHGRRKLLQSALGRAGLP